jgi:hypothetical protein
MSTYFDIVTVVLSGAVVMAAVDSYTDNSPQAIKASEDYMKWESSLPVFGRDRIIRTAKHVAQVAKDKAVNLQQ